MTGSPALRPDPLILAPGLILGIDTTSDYASIALVHATGVIEEVPLQSFEGLGERLFPEIQGLLKRHRCELADLSAIAAGWGPGSFTGIRVGLTAAKGLAEALGKPVVGVSRLMAMASFGSQEVRAVISDARRGEVYAAIYTAGARGLALRGSEAVVKLEDWLRSGVNDAELVLDQELLTNQQLLTNQALASCVAESVRCPRYLAGAVGRIGLERWRRGLGQDPAEIDASYVRRSDGAMVWTDHGSL